MGWLSRNTSKAGKTKVLVNKNGLFDAGSQRISRIDTHEVNQEASPSPNPRVRIAGSKSTHRAGRKRGIPSVNKYFDCT